MNLIPEKTVFSGNYLCTWTLQERVADALHTEGRDGPERQRNVLTKALLFDREDLYHPYAREDRAGLLLLLDDGWDVPFGTSTADGILPFGSLIVDEGKFPGTGDTPAQRLRTLCEQARALGYAGLGVWVAPQEAFWEGEVDWNHARAYWEERARWCQQAGVTYWKVDWGKHEATPGYRELISECAHRFAPGLLVEHALPQSPLTAITEAEEACRRFAFSDVFRTYDIAAPFENADTFARVHCLLSRAPNTQSLINAEDQPMVAAGLGLNLGVMDFSHETLACLRWQRLAPPFAASEGRYSWSKRMVSDHLTFDYQPVHWISNRIGTTYSVATPAAAARGTVLPEVLADGEPPVVLACEHPQTHAYAVSILRRTIEPNIGLILPADVTIHPSDPFAPIGVFGTCRSLRAVFDQPLPEGCTVWAQSLLGKEAKDVTSQVVLRTNELQIDGLSLRLWGHDPSAPCVRHEPAVVLAIRQP